MTLRRPRLSLLSRFAVTSLVVFIVLGVGLAYLLNQVVQRSALTEAQTTAYDSFHTRLIGHIAPRDLETPMKGNRYRQFDAFIREAILSDRTVRVKVWNARGTVIYSSDPRIVGHSFAIEDALDAALHGNVGSDISTLTAAENRDDRKFHRLLEVYIPIRFTSRSPVVGAFEVYQAYEPVSRQISMLRNDTYMLLGGGLLVLYVLLFGIVRGGSNTISRQQRQLVGYTDDLEESYRQTIASLAAAVDARDATTEQHSMRVTELALALGQHLSLTEAELRDLERGAFLHDVGKIGISDTILLKPGPLTDAEWTEMRRHPDIGYQMLRSVSFLQGALPLVRHHHERWDGRGYPDGLSGEQIPFSARLFAVIDAYDAMTSDRPYRKGMSHDEAIKRLCGDAGTHFDPIMMVAFEGMMQDGQPSGAPELAQVLVVAQG